MENIAKKCDFSLENNKFESNYARVQGGAIYFNKNLPQNIDKNEFSNDNYAQYGSNIASFPFGINLIQQDQFLLASGIVQLEEIDRNLKIVGLKQVRAENGITEFKKLIVYGPPSHINAQFRIYSSTINTEYLKSNFQLVPSEKINNLVLSFSFRQCLEGEIQNQDSSACIGGLIPLKTDDIQPIFKRDSDILCAPGYQGNLCDACGSQNGVQLQRTSKHNCAMGILIFFNIKKTHESEVNVVLRIATNYLQIMTTTGAYNLEWPYYLSELFGVYNSLGDAIDSLISIECFFNGSKSFQGEESVYYLKALIVSLFPIFIIFFLSTVLVLYSKYKNIDQAIIREQLFITAVVIIYTLHPTINKFILALFNCIELEKGEYWLEQDLQVRCWTQNHFLWALSIGIPALLIWVIVLPIFLLHYIHSKRKELKAPLYSYKFKMIKQGLRNRYYYWEFVNILRKTILVVANVFMQSYRNIFKSLFNILILSFFLQLHLRLKPYKNPLINALEYREYLCSLVIFFGSLFFVNQEISSETQLLVFIIIVAYNLNFIILWIYTLMEISQIKKLRFVKIHLKKILLIPQSVSETKISLKPQEFINKVDRINKSSNTSILELQKVFNLGSIKGKNNIKNIEKGHSKNSKQSKQNTRLYKQRSKKPYEKNQFEKNDNPLNSNQTQRIINSQKYSDKRQYQSNRNINSPDILTLRKYYNEDTMDVKQDSVNTMIPRLQRKTTKSPQTIKNKQILDHSPINKFEFQIKIANDKNINKRLVIEQNRKTLEQELNQVSNITEDQKIQALSLNQSTKEVKIRNNDSQQNDKYGDFYLKILQVKFKD
ncbi:UNKNOWN [Stylonychia lemnae]|uniref:Transmembrane protein n=1 Tax=Stylonychia lemnae TaxID=5949 RepID=A0A078AP64_STYLE|nr:UNKNOWN [Stylonychia lemnae]|eukprot:CDW84170.1 UNKNOWN [Stylonychia lemnae]